MTNLAEQFDHLGPGCTEADLDEFVSVLDARLMEHSAVVQASHVWQTFMSPESDPALVRLMLREIYLEIYSYQPHVIEACISILAKWPKKDAPRIMTLLHHQAEESDHGEMALSDYVALGGDEEFARTRPISAASFAVASLWWGLWKMESPFVFLGALYPFEGSTPQVSQAVIARLDGLGIPDEALTFLRFHATADLKHAALVRHHLREVAREYKGAADAMLRGMEYFTQVYPLPAWSAAFDRAMAEYQSNVRSHQMAE